MTRFRRRSLRRIRYKYRAPGARSPVDRWADVVETRIDAHRRPARIRQRSGVAEWAFVFRGAKHVSQ
jgi:hypothetical protein